MANYSIGISGLNAAQRAFDVIGNNIANAATEGYHRQRINLVPAYLSQVGPAIIGGGVNVDGVTRIIDNFLEQELLRQKSSLKQLSQEATTLRTVETIFGEFSTSGGLNAAIDEFFNALDDLSAHPTEIIWQEQVIAAAKTMAGQFRTLGQFLTTLETQITLEAQNTIEQINTLINEIAELNSNIERMEIGGGKANNLRDQRDQLITELSELIGVQTQSREYGVVDVIAAGISVVMGSSATELEVGLNKDGGFGVTIAGAYNYSTDVQGGQLNGLLMLKNQIVSDIHSDLDDLAGAIIQQINQYHVQAVGSSGSFTDLTGWVMPSEDLADFEPPITSGEIYIRIIDKTDPGTTTITRHKIEIPADADSLTTLAAAIEAIDIGGGVTPLTASVVSSKLSISADANYKFDFLPGVLSEPTTSNLTPDVSISGTYTGSTNQTYTCTVVGDGEVGNDDNLQIEVKIGTDVIKTLDVGSYEAGARLKISDEIYISIGTGQLNNGEIFTIEALASSDTSGVLAAVGLNTFFSGSNATEMAVRSDIAATPGRIATSLGPDMTDNTNAERMADVKDQAVSSLNTLTPGEFYRRLVMNIGQHLYVKQMQQDNAEVMVQNLTNQQSEISGVNINDEAAQLLVFGQMFQAMAKYMNMIQLSIDSIMELI